MKVKELIQQLTQLDPEALVIVDSYEGGIIEPLSPREVEIVLDVHTEDYYGPHDLASPKETGIRIKGAYLQRPSP